MGVHETGRVRGSEPSGRAGESSTAAQRLREEQGCGHASGVDVEAFGQVVAGTGAREEARWAEGERGEGGASPRGRRVRGSGLGGGRGGPTREFRRSGRPSGGVACWRSGVQAAGRSDPAASGS